MSAFVSTGQLPRPELVRALVDDAYERFRANTDGETSSVYPALRDAPPDRFGIAVVATSGDLHTVGDADDEFAIMSVSKPFVFALVCDALGPEPMRSRRVGANATGLPFNSLEAVERSEDGRTNPMVNPGAIATTSRVSGRRPRVALVVRARGPLRFAGRSLGVDEAVYGSASETNHRNRELARALDARGPPGQRPERGGRPLHPAVQPRASPPSTSP